MKKLLLIGAGLLAAAWASIYFGDDHQRFLEFDRQRDAWHRKCDLYIGVPDARLDAAGQACLQEFKAMQAYAHRQGWDR